MKKLLLYISLLFLANITFAQVKVGANGNIIATGIYPVANGSDIKGTLHFFQTIVQRNALPANFRDTGMLAYVADSTMFYYLNNGILNSNWAVLKGGSIGIDSTNLSTNGDTTFLNLYRSGVVVTKYYWQGDGAGGSGGGSDSTTASNGLTLVGKDVQLGGTLSGITFINGAGNGLLYYNLSQMAIGTVSTNPDTLIGSYQSHQLWGLNNVSLYNEYDSAGSGNHKASSGVTLSIKHTDINANSSLFPYFDPIIGGNLGTSLSVYPDGVYFKTNYFLGNPDSANAKNTIFHINVDSSAIPNPNNIAYFDNDTLKRGSIPLMQAGTPTSSSDSRGNTGDQLYDSSYIYIKTSAGWKRTALTTF